MPGVNWVWWQPRVRGSHRGLQGRSGRVLQRCQRTWASCWAGRTFVDLRTYKVSFASYQEHSGCRGDAKSGLEGGRSVKRWVRWREELTSSGSSPGWAMHGWNRPRSLPSGSLGTSVGERQRWTEKGFEVHQAWKVLWRKESGVGQGSLSNGRCGNSTWSDQGRSHRQGSLEKICAFILASTPSLSHMCSGIQGGASKGPPQSGPGTRWGCPSSQAGSKGRQGARLQGEWGISKAGSTHHQLVWGVTESMKKSRTAVVLPVLFSIYRSSFQLHFKGRGASLPSVPSPRSPFWPSLVHGLAGLSLHHF